MKTAARVQLARRGNISRIVATVCGKPVSKLMWKMVAAHRPHLKPARYLLIAALDLLIAAAVAHKIAVTVFYLLSRQSTYREAVASDFAQRDAVHARRRAIQVLERQGYRVTIEPAA